MSSLPSNVTKFLFTKVKLQKYTANLIRLLNSTLSLTKNDVEHSRCNVLSHWNDSFNFIQLIWHKRLQLSISLLERCSPCKDWRKVSGELLLEKFFCTCNKHRFQQLNCRVSASHSRLAQRTNFITSLQWQICFGDYRSFIQAEQCMLPGGTSR